MVYIKGPADRLVRSLVANAEVDIKIVDDQPFSFEELEERKIEVHRALQAQGFRHISTGFSITCRGQIVADVMRQPGRPDNPSEIRSRFPSELRESVTLTVRDEPIGRLNMRSVA